MPTALVTGVTGQDGSYLAERLVAEGWQVHGLVRPGSQCPVADVVAHTGDLADAAGLGGLIAVLRPAEIYNLGGSRRWRRPGPSRC